MAERIISCQALPQHTCLDFLYGTHLGHTHLDWVSPGVRLFGEASFALWDGKAISALLTASLDQNKISWLLIYRSLLLASFRPNFTLLYTHTKAVLRSYGVKSIFSLSFSDWYKKLLIENSFEQVDEIISLERKGARPEPISGERVDLSELTERDIPAILTLDENSFSAEWQIGQEGLQAVLSGRYYGLIAKHNGVMIAYALSTLFEDRSHLARIAVHPKFSHQGIASQLMHKQLVDQIAMGISHFTVNTQSENTRSRKLYASFGYQELPERVPVFCASLE